MSSFPEMARTAFGKRGGLFLSSILYFELFSCLAIFIVSMGEHMHELVPSIGAPTHDIILTALLIIPTALLRTPKLLSYLSTVGTISTILVVLAVIVNAFIMGDISEEVTELQQEQGLIDGEDSLATTVHHESFRLAGLPVALGLVAFCFSGHAVVPSIYTSMANPHEFEQMVNLTFSFVLVACVTVGLCGYYTFGNAVSDQITLSLSAEPRFGTSNAITILTGLMVITAFSKFTLTLFPLALGMEEIVAPLFQQDAKAMESVKDTTEGKGSAFTNVFTILKKIIASLGIRIGLLFLALLVALYVPSFSFLCSLVGLICTMAVSVVFPAATHLSLFGKNLSTAEKSIDYLFIVFGTVSAVVGTIAAVSHY
jgi:vesicular inhibitory amino acid transporter